MFSFLSYLSFYLGSCNHISIIPVVAATWVWSTRKLIDPNRVSGQVPRPLAHIRVRKRRPNLKSGLFQEKVGFGIIMCIWVELVQYGGFCIGFSLGILVQYRGFCIGFSFAGVIIGKGGVNSKQIVRLTGAKLAIRKHETDPSLRNIELEGTFDQIKQASAMVRELIVNISSAAAPATPASNYKTKLCENFAKGSCTFGEWCHLAHGASDLRKSSVPRSMVG
ncbi:uncharacterized protein LOC131244370 [Magnolia sinica]|uniref:uncharacterized protein LOC131244370 n=1 Tax=Magnolia sinica TaxID=86752 RepID=UPI0026597741|nr:uncharacterized protein LOC131244370 [Magnolia sinica]